MRLSSWILMFLFVCSPLLAQETSPKPSNEPLPTESVKEQTEKPLDFWMEKKLGYTTEIMRGLALGDFDLIESNASLMRLLNKIEGFVRSRNGEYRTNVHTFERATDEIIRQANKENIEGVTLAFHQLTVSCVRCHETLREPQ